MSDQTSASTAQARPLSQGEHAAVIAVAAATGLLGGLGFLNSFARVAHAAESSFGWFSWTVPLGIDLGIAVFSALDIVLSRINMRVRWLRLIPWSLTAATVYLNISGETTVFGRVAHATLPLLWVVAVEVAAHTIKTHAGMVAGTRMDQIRRSRWVLAPAATARLWRRMVLWEIRSYPDALDRERARLLALTDLQDTYGRWLWRWKAPRRARALYRLGEHHTTDTTPPSDTPETVEPVATPRRTGTPRKGRTSARPKTRTAASTETRTDDELVVVLADVPRDPDGTVPIRRAARALKCGPGRAKRLLHEQGLLEAPDTTRPEPSTGHSDTDGEEAA